VENEIMKKEKPVDVEVRALLSTMNQVASRIPGCEFLASEYVEKWTSNDATEEELKEMRMDIKKPVHLWMKDEDEEKIVNVVKTLHPACRSTLYGLVRKQFRSFFESTYKALPNDFAAPTPFLVMERSAGNWIQLDKPIILKRGRTKIEIKGTALKAEDGWTTFALLLLTRQKKLEITRKNVYFRTTIIEIAKTMLKTSNPYSKSTRNAIWSSLERLRGSVLTLINPKGLRTLGGILDGAMELEEDSNLEVGIYLDRNFIELIDEGYIKLDPEIYFKLSPSQANLYAYLQRQESFNQYGCLNPVSIEKVIDASGLRGLHPENKTKSMKRCILKHALEGLQKKEVVSKFTIKDDKLKITSKRKKKDKDVENIPLTETIAEKEAQQAFICPYGHEFGIDCEKFEKDCDECAKWDKCLDANLG
jgi:hypothetical protein